MNIIRQKEARFEILKAAGEMRNRIFASLERAHDDAPPEQEHERLTWDLARKVLVQSGRLTISVYRTA